jgi:SulP family sulfate permease
MRPERWLPALAWGPAYRPATLAADLQAATIVTIMLIPQSLAYAMLAGLPPQMGLYASMLPLVAYALFGSSRVLAVGPVAVISLMTLAAAGRVGQPGSAEFIAAALLLAALSGAILLVLGALRLGFLANFLSHPVISGFISASGVLIATSQLRHILGIPGGGDTLPELLIGLWANLGAANQWTIAIGIAAIGFLVWARRYLRPLLRRLGLDHTAADALAKAGPLAAVAVTTLMVAMLQLDATGVRIVGAIPQGLPAITLPPLERELVMQLLPAALLLALIGFVESVSVAQTLAAKRRQRIDPDQELVGLGAANLAASVSGGYPVTGGLARSVVNFDAGAQTPMAGVLTALGIALTALFLTPAFHYLPQAVLAATIIVAVIGLVDLPAIRRTWRHSKTDFAAMATTMALVLLVGVEPGVLVGIVLSLLLFLWRTSRPHLAVVGQVPGTEHFRNVLRHQVVTSPIVLTVRVDESLYFANARFLEDRLLSLAAENPRLRHLVLMCPAVNDIDASALESLETIAERLAAAGVIFHLSEVKGPVMDRLKRSDFFRHFRGTVFLNQYQAMLALDPETTRRAMTTRAPTGGA